MNSITTNISTIGISLNALALYVLKLKYVNGQFTVLNNTSALSTYSKIEYFKKGKKRKLFFEYINSHCRYFSEGNNMSGSTKSNS